MKYKKAAFRVIPSLFARYWLVLIVLICSETLPGADKAYPGMVTTELPIVDVRVLSDRWIAVVLDPSAQILAKRDELYLQDIQKDIKDNPPGSNADWLPSMSINYHTLSVFSDFRKSWVPRLEDARNWQVDGGAPTKVSLWSQSVDGFPMWRADWPAKHADILGFSRVADFVYIQCPAPMSAGVHRVELSGLPSASFIVNERQTVCWSLKVNQMGYLPDAGKKYAYLGMWLGSGGACDLSSLAGRPFAVYACMPSTNWRYSEVTGAPLFEGRIALRKRASEMVWHEEPITGEDVYELDFSGFSKPGCYALVVPGIGHSWPFRIGNDAYGDAFATMARGMYHQRCGIDLKQPYTAWVRPACHTTTYRGGHIGECLLGAGRPDYDIHYQQGGKVTVGFHDKDGNPTPVELFTMVGSTTSSEVIPDCNGGWHDAADFDRRVGHYGCVTDLCAAFELSESGTFTDGQLNIPESGNGIPDILDEACIQIELFRRTMTQDGGVSDHIEERSHPVGTPWADPLPVSASIPDRWSSLYFAYGASYLSRLLAPYDAKRSREYLALAQRAYSFGMNPAHRLRGVTFIVSKDSHYDPSQIGKEIIFDERDENEAKDGWLLSIKSFAIMQMYLATGDQKYADDFKASKSGYWLLHPLSGCGKPFIYASLVGQRERVRDLMSDDEIATVRRGMEENCNRFLQGQQEMPYRQMNYATSDGYFGFQGWGNMMWRSSYAILMWKWTGEKRFRDAALLGVDWVLGCNELGRSFATGMGSTHPVIFQHIHSDNDDILESIPGVVPYTFALGVPRQVLFSQVGLIDGGHASAEKYFKPMNICLIPKEMGRDTVQAKMDATEDFNRKAQIFSEALSKKFPIWRRSYTHPYSAPPVNEFVINDGISDQAAIFGILMGKGCKPSDAVLHKTARNNWIDLPIYLQP